MATDPGLIEYLCDQLEGLGTIRSRKMFGEYMIYCNDKPVLIICNDRPMVKTLPILTGRPSARRCAWPKRLRRYRKKEGRPKHC